MSLQGTLDTFALADILQFLAHAQKTGALHVRGDDSGVVYFHEGEIVFASSRTSVTLGETLVAAALVTDEQWRTVMAESDSRPLSELLVWAGVVDADRLRTFLQQHVEEALFDQLLWEKGEFQFRGGDTHPLGPTFTFALPPVMSRVHTRVEHWATIRERIPSMEIVLEPAPTLPAQHREVTVTADEWRLIVAVDGRRTVDELSRALGQGTFQTCSTLSALLDAGLVRPVEAGPRSGGLPLAESTPATGWDHVLPASLSKLDDRPADAAGAPATGATGAAPPDTGISATAAGVAALRAFAREDPRPEPEEPVRPALAANGTTPWPDRNLVRRLLAAVKDL